MHGQWDWMNDPEIHSSNWEWDTAQPAEQWKHSPQLRPPPVHQRARPRQRHRLRHPADGARAEVAPGQPRAAGLQRAARRRSSSGASPCTTSTSSAIRKGEKDPKEMKRQLRQIGRKGRNQIAQGLRRLPGARPGRQWKTTMTANATANLTRNLWSYMIIFCGHFPDGALHFTEEELEDETRAEWYLRQMLGVGELQGRPAAAHHVRQPRLPDRAPPLPGPAEQPLRRDLGAGAGAVRQVRHPLHDRAAAPAVRPGAAHDHEAVAAEPHDLQRPARAAERRRDRPRGRHVRRRAPARRYRSSAAGPAAASRPPRRGTA